MKMIMIVEGVMFLSIAVAWQLGTYWPF